MNVVVFNVTFISLHSDRSTASQIARKDRENDRKEKTRKKTANINPEPSQIVDFWHSLKTFIELGWQNVTKTEILKF